MDRLIAPNSVPFAARDIAPTTGTPQYATDGNPVGPIPPTIWPAYAFNMIQDEILAVIVAAGLTPDDTNWGQLVQAIRALKNVQTFSTSGSFTVPTGVTRLKIRLWGAGGGGGGSLGFSAGGSGGGGGGYAEGVYTVTPGAIFAVTAGVGGSAGSNAPSNGGNGGASSFGAIISASGGGGGIAGNGAPATTAGAGGTGFLGLLNVSGAGGALPTTVSSSVITVGQGGAAFATPANLQSSANVLYNGSAGLAPGGGATAGALSGAGGVGANGLVLVEW